MAEEPVNIRELMTLLENVKKDILSEVKQVNANMESRIIQVDTEMDKRFDVHKVEHEKENERRHSLMRWAVTTLIMFTGLGISAYSVMEALGG